MAEVKVGKNHADKVLHGKSYGGSLSEQVVSNICCTQGAPQPLAYPSHWKPGGGGQIYFIIFPRGAPIEYSGGEMASPENRNRRRRHVHQHIPASIKHGGGGTSWFNISDRVRAPRQVPKWCGSRWCRTTCCQAPVTDFKTTDCTPAHLGVRLAVSPSFSLLRLLTSSRFFLFYETGRDAGKRGSVGQPGYELFRKTFWPSPSTVGIGS